MTKNLEVQTDHVSSFGENSKLDTLVVVPCYNEADRLDQSAYLDFINRHENTGFVFVDDGSSDETLSVLIGLRVKCASQVEVITLSQNSGKAEAVRSGLIYAASLDTPFLAYWDADLATPLTAITDFQSVIKRYDNLELVYGARRTLMGHRIHRTLTRRIVSRICATLARLAISMPVSDTQCGAKLFRNSGEFRSAISKPFAAGWLFDIELFARLSKLISKPKTAFYEYPLSEWDEVEGSKITGSAVVRAGFSVLGLIARFRLLGEKPVTEIERLSTADEMLGDIPEPVASPQLVEQSETVIDFRNAA